MLCRQRTNYVLENYTPRSDLLQKALCQAQGLFHSKIFRTVTISGNNWSISNLSVSLDNNYQWDVQVKIVDIFTSTAIDLSLPVGMANFFIGTDGRVSVGIKPSNSLYVAKNGIKCI